MPGDYFAINTPPAVFAKLGMHVVNLPEFSHQVGEQLAGRTGGAVSLAIGMAQIFRGIPGMKSLTAYWYHYAIMFEALFILTTIDAGTRVARYVMQELMGKTLQAPRPQQLAALEPARHRHHRCLLGIPHLGRHHLDPLAALRHSESAARLPSPSPP